MKKTLALIVAIAMVLSLAVTAFVFTASADATNWNAYAEEKWAAEVAAGNAASSVVLRNGRYGANLTVAAGASVDLSTSDLFPYNAGTVSLSTDGVLTLSGLTRPEGNTDFAVIIGFGALKVVIDGEFDGCIRNDESNATGGKGGLYITGDATNGGIWTCSANNDDMDVNNFRTRNGLYVYGNIGFDVDGVFQFDTAVGEVVLAPALNSKIDSMGKEIFMKKNSGYAEKLVVAGGATVTIDDATATTFTAAAPVTSIIVDGANLVWEDEFAECGGDDYNLLPNITLKNDAKFTAATVYPGAEASLLAKITCEDYATFYIGEELKKGEVAPELTGWAKYSEDKWAAEVAAGNAASKVQLRNGRYGTNLEIAAGQSVDLSTTNLFPYNAGTVSLSNNGVLTLSGLARPEGNTDFAVIIGYGALKVVIDGEYDGCIRNDESNAAGGKGGLYITGKGANGGTWTCSANNDDMDVNNFRTRNGLYIYGNIGFDVDGVFQFDTAVGEAVLAPEKDSKIDSMDKEIFMKKNSGYAEKLVVAGGATVTIDDGTATTFKTDAPVTSIIVDGADLVWEDEFAECNGDNPALIPAITLKNGAKFTAATVYPGMEAGLLEKITCEDTATFFIGEEQKLPEVTPEPELTGWAKYAEDKWAAATAKATSATIGAHGTNSPQFVALANGDVNVDLAGKGPFAAGTASFVDGVLTLKNLEYAEGATQCPEIRGYNGAIKLVVDGCTYKGHFRNDYGSYNAHNASIWLTAKNDGVFAPDCSFFGTPDAPGDYYGNSLRSGHSIYVYNILTDIHCDGFVTEDKCAEEELIFAPVDGSVLEVVDHTNTQGLFLKNKFVKIVFAGDVTIDMNNETTFGGSFGAAQWIIDGADVAIKGFFAECSGDNYANISNIILKNGATLDVEAFYNDTATLIPVADHVAGKLTCEDTSAYYVAGELVEYGPDFDTGSGDEGGEGGEDVGGEGGEGNEDDNVEEDPTGFVPNKETFWEKYAEEKWAAEDTSNSYVVIGYPSDSNADLVLNAENNSVDFAALVEAGTPFWCYKAGTMTFENGVLTIKDIEYNEGHASSCNDGMIVGYEGAIKVVIDGCDFVGTIRNDWGADAAIYVQGVNGGSWSCGIIGADGEIAEEKGTDNLVRSEGDFYAYGDLTLDWYANVDGVIRLDNADCEAVIAPQGGAYIKTNCPLVFTKSGSASRLVLAGGNVITFDATAMINIAGTGSFPVVLGEVIVDSTKVEYKNNIFGIIETQPKYVLKNGAVLAVDSAFKTVEVTVEHGAYYVGGQLVKANAPAGGEGEGGGNSDTSAALVVPFVVMIALTSAAAVMIVRKKRA